MSGELLLSQFSEDNILKCVSCKRELVDGVLLNCLHSACKPCTISDETATVTCSVCQVKTDVSVVKSNLLVSLLARRLLVLKNVFSCPHCLEADNQYPTAVVWCYTCQKSMCVDTQKFHNTFNSSHEVVHLNERTNLLELYRPLPRPCNKHNEEVKHACFTCEDVCCYKCVHDCYMSRHAVLPIDGPDALKRIEESVTQATASLSDLNSAVTVLKDFESLSEKVARAREESLSILKNAKKAAVDSISSAYDSSAVSLLECWDTLAVNSLGLQESAQRLKAKVDWANEYCQMALNSNDIAGLLPQLTRVMSCLRALLDEARQFKEPINPLTLVSFNVCLPRDLDLIASGWFGTAKIVSDDFQNSENVVPADESKDYYTRKVSTLNELEQLLQIRKEQHQVLDLERHAMDKLQSDVIVKVAQLAASQNEVQKLHDQKQVQQEQLELSRMTIEQLQSELKSKTQQLDVTKNEVKRLSDKEKEQQVQLDRERRTIELLKSELNSKTQQLAAPTKPLSFDSRKRGTFNGPGRCFDVALMPQGNLLVATMANGLKEYDGISFTETATWMPDSELIGQGKSVRVRTVAVLSDGTAIVGLNPKLVVLLRRGISSGGGSVSSAEAWRVERLVAELRTPPRHMSAWDDRLLAVLEDRYDDSLKDWYCGPGLVLLSLCGNNGKELHRQQLDYNAGSVVLTDRGVIVSSDGRVELSDAAGRGGGNGKTYVVDCYSHLGIRLWRHEVGGGLKVMSVCSDSVGRVLYAAKRGSVVALSVDDGHELITAMKLSTNPYAIALDKATQRLLALISFGDNDQPNTITMFSVT